MDLFNWYLEDLEVEIKKEIKENEKIENEFYSKMIMEWEKQFNDRRWN